MGLVLRLRTTLVVLTAGVVTGLLAGLPLFTSAGVFEGIPYLSKAGQEGIINTLGQLREYSPVSNPQTGEDSLNQGHVSLEPSDREDSTARSYHRLALRRI